MKTVITIGSRVGNLTVLGRTSDPKYSCKKRAHWDCKCNCGSVRAIDQDRLVSNKVKGCRKCAAEATRGRENIWSRKGYGESLKKRRMQSYRSNARHRGLEHTLTDEQMETLFQGDCYYCGGAPSRVFRTKHHYGEYKCNGIDRKDSYKGYTPENSVSCCWDCNFIKKDYDSQHFIALAKKISSVLNSKQSTLSSSVASLQTENELCPEKSHPTAPILHLLPE